LTVLITAPQRQRQTPENTPAPRKFIEVPEDMSFNVVLRWSIVL
uniref:Uma2 family endonuclease n=1 Tax=Gongylonema pulchrum TaxID=637853 RepID=A0A183EDA8_9BILA